MSRRGITILGLAAAGGIGYYLYNAGGDPKVAQKQFEADASKATAKIKSEAPGKEKEAEKKGEATAAQAGQKFDKAMDDARSKLQDAKNVAAEYKEKTGNELNKAIDSFDKTVEQKSSEAKKGLSSWFGGGGNK